MLNCDLRFVKRTVAEHYTSGCALDVGAGTLPYRQREKFPYDLSQLFDFYETVDVKPGKGIDHVLDAERLTSSLPERTFAVVLATSLLEHCRRPWIVVEQCYAMLRPSGLFIASVPWMYPEHPDPIDCWRVSPDGMRALCESLFEEIECGTVEESGFKITIYAGRAV